MHLAELAHCDWKQMHELADESNTRIREAIKKTHTKAEHDLIDRFGEDVDIDVNDPLARREQALRCLLAISEGNRRRIVFAANRASENPPQGWEMMRHAETMV